MDSVHRRTRNGPGLDHAARNNDLDRVRDASDIVDVVGEVVALKAKGREYVCLCPFHDDHNPSMYVVPAKQMFNCFVCGAAGDVFTFVQRYHSMGFAEALKYLAERAGIELTPRAQRRQAAPGETTNDDIANVNRFARDFFRAILKHPQHGEAARDVIEARGISREMVEAFELGASPDKWDGLLLAGKTKEVSEQHLADAGLIKRRESGTGAYDALRNRLIFPIHDKVGRVVAFGGRKINPEDEPKYLNSPETALFKKNKTLYGSHQAWRAIQKARTAIVVEGYTDVIACHQAGVANVVGTLGTALTAGHAKELRLVCDTIVLLLDADEAGQAAAERGQDRLLDELASEIFFGDHPLDVRIAGITPEHGAKDPDELLARDDGKATLESIIDDAPGLIAFRMRRLRARTAGAGPVAWSRAVEAELNRLSELGLGSLPALRKDAVLRELASATGMSKDALLPLIGAGRRASGRSARRQSDDAGPARPMGEFGPAELALGCLLHDASLWRLLASAEKDLLDVERFPVGSVRDVVDIVHRLGTDGSPTNLKEVLAELDAELEEASDSAPWLAAKQAAAALEDAVSRRKTPDGPGVYLKECLEHISRSEIAASRGSSPEERLAQLRSLHELKKTNPGVRLSSG